MALAHSAIKIALAVSAAARECVYRFRYELYVEEMRRTQHYADHDRRQICEPLDTSGHILAAYDDCDQIVGTVRYNVSVDEHFGIYTELYRLNDFGPFFPKQLSITTKLMLRSKYRRTGLAGQLAIACYRNGLELGTCFDFIDCNPPLVPFFEHLGYRRTCESIQHPEYGEVVPLVLAMHDVAHLEKVGSPFVQIGRQFRDENRSVEFFHDSALAGTRNWVGLS